MLITPIVYFFSIDVATIETFFGSIPTKFSFGIPAIDLNQLPNYFAPALTIALLGGIESLLSAVVADGMISGKHRSNTELIAQGIANIITPFFGGIPATGAVARTATNVKNGGRTPIAGMVHAITLLLIMLFLGRWAKLIPMSCLAGILIVVAYNMSEWRSFLSILKGSYFDVLILIITFGITVFYDLTLAIEIGVLLSAVLFMKRVSDISEKRIDHIVDKDLIENYSDLPDSVRIYEISGPFFFASARRYSEAIEEIGLTCKVLIIRMRHVSFIDATGLHNLKDTVKILRNKNITILLSGVNPEIREQLVKYQLTQLIPADLIFDNFDSTTKKAFELVETQAPDESHKSEA